MMWWDTGPEIAFGAFGILYTVFGLLLSVGVIIVIIWLVIRLSKGDTSGRDGTEASQQPERPIQIVKERYARGEISREEYQQIKKDLMD